MCFMVNVKQALPRADANALAALAKQMGATWPQLAADASTLGHTQQYQAYNVLLSLVTALSLPRGHVEAAAAQEVPLNVGAAEYYKLAKDPSMEAAIGGRLDGSAYMAVAQLAWGELVAHFSVSEPDMLPKAETCLMNACTGGAFEFILHDILSNLAFQVRRRL
jgi:hypothetical protein